ncbi:MAG: divalent metal cation transporter [Planctomycetota bacterium]|nr:divalent metal cation transporter [Planctomycetota bacterium]
MSDQVAKNREMIVKAQQEGLGSTLVAYTKLSGPGWLQSAITLGGGSLSGALFLGVLTGTNLLWVQLIMIVMGVIMLSAISHVTLSTGKKPFQEINNHVNPVLGWGWLVATCAANMLWCMPQFSLSFAALNKNLAPGLVEDTMTGKMAVSAVLLLAASFVLYLNNKEGRAAKAFDFILKGMVAIVVISFFAAVMIMSGNGSVDWGGVFAGFIPDLSQWSQPTGELAALITGLGGDAADFWNDKIVAQQRDVIIGAAATAVGINMTFLLPYSMLARGWDKPFRGMAKFDLSTGMVIPYLLVTTCVVIASATMFHAGGQDFEKTSLASSDITVMSQSEYFKAVAPILTDRLGKAANGLSEEELHAKIAVMPMGEKQLASSLVKRNAFQLSSALAPIFGEGEAGKDKASLIFGIGVLGMGFSTIIILMLINGYAFCEMFNVEQGSSMHMIGCLVSGVCGAIWPLVWDGPAKLWLAIAVSSFGFILLPIAYTTFFMMMNNKKIMGKERPEGGSRILWNILMGVSCIVVLVAVIATIYQKVGDEKTGTFVLGMVVVYVIAVIFGFVMKKPASIESATEAVNE